MSTCPNKFLNTLIEKLHLKNDAALARAVCMAPPVISKIRHGRIPIGSMMLIRAHELTEEPIREIRKWAEAA